MKSDLSRDTFDPAKHLTRVLMQQGRVTVDADHNEQVSILLHYLWTLAADLVGPHAGPVNGGGFHLGPPPKDSKGIFSIGQGRYYVDGILVENEADTTYAGQADYPLDADDPLAKSPQDNPPTFLAYLDVWERHITPIEDDAIREVALGGPDTCNRARLVWQVRVAPPPQTTSGTAVPAETDLCKTIIGSLPRLSQAKMTARLDPGQQIPDPCVMAPESRFRGAENQLYRVEVHTSGTAGTATFKWSRENGSVVTRWVNTAGRDLLVGSTRGFAAGNWVELSDETLDLQGKPGTLVKIASVDAGVLTVDPAVPDTTIDWTKAGPRPKIRRWDQFETEDEDHPLFEGAIPIQKVDATSDVWITLEDAIQVQFNAGGTYRTGDYWLIPARVATGDIEWPSEGTPSVPIARPPNGIEHHYAPLGLVTWNGTTWEAGNTCRCDFAPLQCQPPANQ
jgi:hypothetical protein